MRQAIYQGIDLTRNRRQHAEALADPLPKARPDKRQKEDN